MAFYGQMLSCKKIILCYPENDDKVNTALHFYDDQFYLKKVHAAYMNIGGNSAKEFKDNIASFIFNDEADNYYHYEANNYLRMDFFAKDIGTQVRFILVSH